MEKPNNTQKPVNHYEQRFKEIESFASTNLQQKNEQEEGYQEEEGFSQETVDQEAVQMDNNEGTDSQENKTNEELDLDHLKSKKLKLKVNGQEREASLDDLVKVYQKTEAADKKLQEASLLQKQLLEDRRKFEEERSKLLDMQQKLLDNIDKPVQEQPSPEDAVKAQDVFETFLSGDQEGAAEKLLAIIDAEVARRSNKTATVSTEDVTKLVDKKLQEVQVQARWDAAAYEFKKSNPDIVNDSDLAFLMQSKIERIAQERMRSGQEIDPFEVVQAAKTELDGFVGKFKATQTQETMSQREKRKNESLKNIVSTTPNSRVVQMQKGNEQQDLDPIAQMRKMRGF